MDGWDGAGSAGMQFGSHESSYFPVGSYPVYYLV
jgi:hypothetical protein